MIRKVPELLHFFHYTSGSVMAYALFTTALENCYRISLANRQKQSTFTGNLLSKIGILNRKSKSDKKQTGGI